MSPLDTGVWTLSEPLAWSFSRVTLNPFTTIWREIFDLLHENRSLQNLDSASSIESAFQKFPHLGAFALDYSLKKI
jgi:hypothetical protein